MRNTSGNISTFLITLDNFSQCCSESFFDRIIIQNFCCSINQHEMPFPHRRILLPDMAESLAGAAADEIAPYGPLEQFLGLSDFTMRSLSGEEIAEMNQCEMEILAAHDFSAHVEQPLDYTDEKVKPFLNNEGIEKAILRLQLMFLCSNRFFDYPHEVVALVITQKALAQCESLPREVQEWIDDVISRFDPAIITATAQMMEETQKRMEETQNRMKK